MSHIEEKNPKYYLYVCPTCLNKLSECQCRCLPETLIQIDKNILPIIKILNSKGYRTESCCEGHINSFEKIFIQFRKSYRFKHPLPKDFEDKKGVIIAQICGKSDLAKTRKKNELLRSLKVWAENLDN